LFHATGAMPDGCVEIMACVCKDDTLMINHPGFRNH
jgi:hypothetical protein